MTLEQNEYKIEPNELQKLVDALEGIDGEFTGCLNVSLNQEYEEPIKCKGTIIVQITRMKMEWPDIASFKGRKFMEEVLCGGVVNLKDGKAFMFNFDDKFKEGWMSL